MQDPCDLVRKTTQWVVQQAKTGGHVTLSDIDMYQFVDSLTKNDLDELYTPKQFDLSLHFVDEAQPELTLRYLLAVDALNFCFWPSPGLEYEHLAGGIKRSVLKGPACVAPETLASIDNDGVLRLLDCDSFPLPQVEERARLLREVGTVIMAEFQGQVSNLITAAGGSARKLVSLVTMHFPGFRDASVYRGRQVFFYKRAQIFAADIYGAFQGKGPYGAFNDIDQLTCFADYRVPQILRELNMMEFSKDLATRLNNKEEILFGSEEEVEIRAATVVAVEKLREKVAEASREHGKKPPAVHWDWMLWELGESRREQLLPHHRTLTVYY